jgi:hypothetical protein
MARLLYAKGTSESATNMHLLTLSAGVASLSVSFYMLLSLAYPFISFYNDPLFGGAVLLLGGLFFGGFGCLLCWESATGMEDSKTAKKINRKRKRKLVAFQS